MIEDDYKCLLMAVASLLLFVAYFPTRPFVVLDLNVAEFVPDSA